MCEVAQIGGVPAVGYALAHAANVVWAVALPCGMAALLIPFPVVSWRDTTSLHVATLGWVCTWHTHHASMDLH